MKIIAVALLLIGIGLSAAGVFYLQLYSKSHEPCLRFSSMALDKSNRAVAAKGTAGAASLAEDARTEGELAEVECLNASEAKHLCMVTGGSGIFSIIVAAAVLYLTRKRRSQSRTLIADRA